MFGDGIIGFHWSPQLNDPLTLHIQLRYSHGAITPTGLREHHLEPVMEWCTKQGIAVDRPSWNTWRFSSRDDIALVLLRWS